MALLLAPARAPSAPADGRPLGERVVLLATVNQAYPGRSTALVRIDGSPAQSVKQGDTLFWQTVVEQVGTDFLVLRHAGRTETLRASDDRVPPVESGRAQAVPPEAPRASAVAATPTSEDPFQRSLAASKLFLSSSP